MALRLGVGLGRGLCAVTELDATTKTLNRKIAPGNLPDLRVNIRPVAPSVVVTSII